MKLYFIAIFFLIQGPIFAEADCNPLTCRTRTFCCDRFDNNRCATDELRCDLYLSACSRDCRNGCCIDGIRCGTSGECQTLPVLTIVVCLGGFLIFLIALALYKMYRNKRNSQRRVVAVRIRGQELAAVGIVPTGTVVNPGFTSTDSRNPPIKEAEVQPFQQQQQNIYTSLSPMTQQYGLIPNRQQFNYDEIEYGTSAPASPYAS